ncbi:MAG: AMP-binding protein [Lactobacillaceae bacterium]|jgi:acyl-CoA synthetase (AMP-forming)/AMP-acid ligase II|nr:AMP-binding protein [Lactobacillaceae bacterium]
MSNLTEKLTQVLNDNLDKDLIKNVEDETWLTGQKILELIKNYKKELVERGISEGDVVVTALENDKNYPILEQALWEIGATVHPIAPTSGESEIADEIFEYGYKAVFFEKELNHPELLNSSFEDFNFYISNLPTTKMNRESSIALILNTSGTTGKPKRVPLTHQQILNSAIHVGQSQSLAKDDTNMVVMPMFHINAQIISTLSTRVSGGKLVVAKKFSASNFWNQVADNDVTWVSLVPTIISILQMNEKAINSFNARKDEVELKYVRSASFSLPEESLLEFKNTFGIEVVEGYGMTEAASLIALNPLKATKVGSVGLPVYTEIKLLVDDQITDSAGVEGEILLKGDHVISDYLDSNPSSFIDGWLKTGDLGRFDENGYLSIVGRIKELINRGGEKVAPKAIENNLLNIPFIQDVVVVGMPNTLYGEEVTAAVIVSNQGLTDDEMVAQIQNYASEHLSLPERPTKIYFVDDFPRNGTGKVVRNKLVEKLEKM